MAYRVYALRLICFQWEDCFSFYSEVLGWTPGLYNADMEWAESPLQVTAIG